jgi:hypothetical protein
MRGGRQTRSEAHVGRPITWAITLAGLAWAGAVGPVAAQEESDQITIVGRVLDLRSELPVHGAHVGLTVRDYGVLTDENGRFVIQAAPTGSYLLYAGALGYETLNFEIEGVALENEILIRLEPNPIVLEGISVMTDRFERRRRGVATSTRTHDRQALLTAASDNLLEYLRFRDGLSLRDCFGVGRFGDLCTLRRGQETPVQIYIDERPAWGGGAELASYQPHEMYLVEIYGRGRQIRAYTNYFMDRIAKRGRPLSLMPLFW